ncbi:MAG: bacillithiol biosynthesis cysteine-adding enzyme BshC [Bacteroidota bacterium]
MTHTSCPFGHLPFSDLFQKYILQDPDLLTFYETNPFDSEAIQNKSAHLRSGSLTQKLIPVLGAYHETLGIADLQRSALDRMKQEDALAIVTGQQLGVFGGPVFTMYKIITAIQLSKKWEKQLQRPVVPVFWLADEDHDYDEIASLGLFGKDDFQICRFPDDDSGQPVSAIEIPNWDEFKACLTGHLFETEFSEKVWSLIHACYEQGNTHGKAFATLIAHLFSKYGLLVCGSFNGGIKKLLIPVLTRSVTERSRIQRLLMDTSEHISEAYHQQVKIGETNLFFIDDQGKREKISIADSGFSAGNSSWSESELLEAIERSPERFSPNVFLRPIIQDHLLPTLGYVAGPGELAYYAQMKSYYEAFDLTMPVIYPRLSMTLVESGVRRVTEKLPFELPDYYERVEELNAKYIDASHHPDINALFNEKLKELGKLEQQLAGEVAPIDASLTGFVGKTFAGFQNEINKVRGRVTKSIKQQEQVQLQRIEKAKINLFPGGGLQERAIGPLYFMNKYGIDLWDRLLVYIEHEELTSDEHHIIDL